MKLDSTNLDPTDLDPTVLDRAIESAEADGSFELDGVRFVISDLFPSGGKTAFSLIKPRAAIRAYRDLYRRVENPRMLELGIAYGGSVAFHALAATPTRVVAVEIDTDPVEQLVGFITERGLAERVRTHWGVDQSDRARLAGIVDDEFGEDPLDLVIDDASHQYDPTVASFETLFGRVRPGGLYVIEDWTCDHGAARLLIEAHADESAPAHQWAVNMMRGEGPPPSGPGRRPLATVAAENLGAPPLHPDQPTPTTMSRLALQLTLAAADSPEAIASVAVDHEWIVVERGPADLGPGPVRLDELCPDRFGILSTP